MSMIAVYADWLDQYIVWTQHPNFAEYDTADLPKEYEGRGETRFFNNERDLLENFVEWVETYDPDMFVAWNGDGYDFPMLHYRLEVTGVGPQRMSPIVHSTNNQFTSSRDFMAPSNEWTEEGGVHPAWTLPCFSTTHPWSYHDGLDAGVCQVVAFYQRSGHWVPC